MLKLFMEMSINYNEAEKYHKLKNTLDKDKTKRNG